MAKTEELILGSSLGGELSEQEAVVLAGLMSSKTLKDGDFLIDQGKSDDALHVLLQGKLEVVKRVAGDEEVSLAVLREGDLAGALSFVDGETHTVGLRALSDALVVSMHRGDFDKIVDDHPQLVYKVMRAVVRSTHQIVHRMNHEYVELNNYIFKQHGRY